uniref:Uncharacterized protein n=1 Tax=Brassica oleracea var. oleracea TaxID=109376 RepID=A0A0D3BYG5_BRAOL
MRAVGEIPSSNNLRLQNLHRKVDEDAWTNGVSLFRKSSVATCFAMLQGTSLNLAFGKHSGLTTDPLSDGAMVSQIVWLDVRDVFTQIAKDVVGQGLDHGTLTFKIMLVYDRRRSLRGLIQNQCGVSYGTIAYSDVTEGNETQKPEDEAQEVCYITSVESVAGRLPSRMFYERILMTHLFLERIGQPEVDLATIGRKASLCARCYIYSRVFFVTNVFDAF